MPAVEHVFGHIRKPGSAMLLLTADVEEPMTDPAPTSAQPPPWARIVVWALIGTLLVGLAVLLEVHRTGWNVVNVIQPGESGPSVAVVKEDFPRVDIPSGIGLDGQQYYAIAREGFDLDEAAPHLDRARYRLQRILYPGLAALVHPAGGGPGLVWAMIGVGIVAILLGGVATGALAHRLGLDPRLAILFAIAPASYVSLRISTADHLALALLVSAIAFLLHQRHVLATVAATLAVLAKEPLLVPLLGLLLWRRDRQIVPVVVVPAVAAGTWAAVLRLVVDTHERQVIEFTWPFGGIASAMADEWLKGDELLALAVVPLTAAIGVAAIRRCGFAHPLGGPVAAQLGLMIFLIHDAVGLDFNVARIASPALLLGALGLLTSGRTARARPSAGTTRAEGHGPR